MIRRPASSKYWKNYSLIAGQDWSVFAPLNPTSLATYAIPEMSSSGNLWIRSPQVRAEYRHDFSDNTHVQFQLAATDPNLADNPTTFATVRTAGSSLPDSIAARVNRFQLNR